MDTVPMCLLILSVLASGVVGHHVDLDQTDASGHDLDLVKDRVYRSVDSDMRYLLESMQSQLKFVTGNLDTVKRMCNFNNQPPRKGLLISLSCGQMCIPPTRDTQLPLKDKCRLRK